MKTRKRPAALAHLAPASAAGASLALGAGLKTVPLTFPAGGAALHLELGFHPLDHVLEREARPHPQVRSSLSLRSSPAAPAEPEEVLENFPQAAEEVVKAAQIHPLQPGLTIEVIEPALLGIGQDLVGFRDPFEVLFRVSVPGVAVRVVLQGQPPVGAFQVLQQGGPGEFQEFVVVPHLSTPRLLFPHA